MLLMNCKNITLATVELDEINIFYFILFYSFSGHICFEFSVLCVYCAPCKSLRKICFLGTFYTPEHPLYLKLEVPKGFNQDCKDCVKVATSKFAIVKK
jgi:hypothetical protein